MTAWSSILSFIDGIFESFYSVIWYVFLLMISPLLMGFAIYMVLLGLITAYAFLTTPGGWRSPYRVLTNWFGLLYSFHVTIIEVVWGVLNFIISVLQAIIPF